MRECEAMGQDDPTVPLLLAVCLPLSSWRPWRRATLSRILASRFVLIWP